MTQPRCRKCGRYIGDSNLGGYDCDKVSKRASTAWCEHCATAREDPGEYRTSDKQDTINRAENLIEMVDGQKRRMQALVKQIKAGDEAYRELEEAVQIIEGVMEKGVSK